MTPARLILQRMTKHVALLVSLTDIVKRHYEKGEPRDRVRVNEVATVVADELDVGVSNVLRSNVRKATRMLGFTRIVNRASVKSYVGMRRRKETNAAD